MHSADPSIPPEETDLELGLIPAGGIRNILMRARYQALATEANNLNDHSLAATSSSSSSSQNDPPKLKLKDLLPEIVPGPGYIIFSYLSPREFINLALTSKVMSVTLGIQSSPYWKALLKPEFLTSTTAIAKYPYGYQDINENNLIVQQNAFTSFSKHPARRIAPYCYYGILGRQFLVRKIERMTANTNPPLKPDQLAAIVDLRITDLISTTDAIWVGRLTNDTARISDFLRAGKSINQILLIIAIDMIKSFYRTLLYSHYFSTLRIGISLTLCALFASFIESNDKYQAELATQNNNLPNMPNRLTSLQFPDFCAVMHPTDNIGKCHEMTQLETNRFTYDYLVVFLATYSFLEIISLIKKCSTRGYYANIGIKPAVLLRYLIPDAIISMMHFPIADANFNAVNMAATPSYDDLQQLKKATFSFHTLQILCISFLTSFITLLAAAMEYNNLVASSNWKELTDETCIIPMAKKTDLTMLFSECHNDGLYPFETGQKSMDALCSQLCQGYSNKHFNPALILLGLLTLKLFGLTMAILLCPNWTQDLQELSLILSAHQAEAMHRYSIFANSLPGRALLPGPTNEGIEHEEIGPAAIVQGV
jgi:hypothetical protein